ncbi:MAG: PAS domain S-box protein [Bacteroidales bacterium]|nr:PAS domain S-box protein [Bacteroidales bacterium]
MSNHTKDVKLIQDISLLYELALSIGHSFELKENIHSFIRILAERKNIDIASVWLRPEIFEGLTPKNGYKLVYSFPELKGTKQELSQEHPVLKTLGNRASVSVSYLTPGFEDIITEKGVYHGVFTIYRLGDIGFLKLYQYARKHAWEEQEQNKLIKIVHQFAISIQSCVDHDLTVKETKKRIQTEQKLKEREQRLLEVVNTIDDGFFVFDLNEKKFVFLSPAFESIFGLDREQVYANPYLIDRLIVQNAEGGTYSFITDLSRDTRMDHEFEIETPQRNQVSVWSKHQQVLDQEGNPWRIVGTFRDVTEKQRILSDLEYRLEFEDLLLDISNSFINLSPGKTNEGIDNALAKIGHFTQADRSYIFLFHSNGELMSNTHEWCAEDIRPEIENLQNLPKDTFPWWVSKLKKFEAINLKQLSDLPEEAHAEKELLQSQSIKSLAVIPLILSNQLKGFIGFDFVRRHVSLSNDLMKLLRFVGQIVVNAIDRGEKDVWYKEQGVDYKNLVESAADIIYRLDKNGRFLYMNQKALGTFGFSAAELKGQDIQNIVHPDYSENVTRFYRDQLDKNIESTYLEFPIITQSGEKIWVGQNTSLISLNNDQKELAAIAREITDIINANKSLRQAYEESEKANQSKTRFVVNTSHEIRTPVHAISGLVKMFQNTRLSENQKDLVSKLNNTTRGLNNLIDNVIDFKKIEAETLELQTAAFIPVQVLDDVFAMLSFLAENNGVRLQKHLDPSVPESLVGDEGKLQRILLNLLENAIKFNQNGTARIAWEVGEEKDKKQYYDFMVEDDGIGISGEVLNQLERSFRQGDESNTRQYEGAGLGLFISGELIKMMGGKLQIEKPQTGTKIRFSIPFEPSEEKQQTAEMEQKEKKTFPGIRVLIVEDNKINRLVAAKALENLEIKHDAAENGKAALEYLSQNTYDVVLMDLMMPDMDGFETSRHIRNDLQLSLPIIACTAKKVKGTEKDCYDAGMNDFLSKPFDEDDIREKLKKLLG